MGKFLVKKTNTGFMFDLKAANGETIATSEVYNTEASCLKGIESIRKCCNGEIEDQTSTGFVKLKHPKFEIFRDEAGLFRFRLKARNGEVIAVSESYKAKASAIKGITSVKKNAPASKTIKDYDL